MSKISNFLIDVEESFDEKYSKNKTIQSLEKKLVSGKVSQEDAFEYAKQVGNLRKVVLHDKLQGIIEESNDGYLLYQEAKELFDNVLYNDYDLINEYCKETFTSVNKQNGINLKGVNVEYSQDKTDGIIKVATKDKYEKVSAEVEEAIKTNAKSYYDTAVRQNAKFQYDSGLKPKIIRTTFGKTCKWCQSLAGVYDYNKVSGQGNDVFRRHANCDCLVVFQPAKGKYQDVYSKQWMQDKQYIEEQQKRIEYSQIKNQPYKDVTKEYLKDATPKKGNYDYDKDYPIEAKQMKEEIKIGKYIHDNLGGDMRLLYYNNYKGTSADYLWNDELWELKTPETLKGVDKLIRTGLSQIYDNPGGIILDISSLKNTSIDSVIDKVNKRVKRSSKSGLDVIILNNNGIKKIVRY